MKVILLADIQGTGKKEDIINVSDGYARNYLFPRKLAVEATKSAMNAIVRSKAAESHRENLRRQEAMETAAGLRNKEILMTARAGEKGRLYGSITGQEVADALSEQHGIKVDKRKVDLSEPIRAVGEYEATVWLYAGVTVPMKIVVKPEA